MKKGSRHKNRFFQTIDKTVGEPKAPNLSDTPNDTCATYTGKGCYTMKTYFCKCDSSSDDTENQETNYVDTLPTLNR